MDTYDVVVLGAGPAGENVAQRVVRGGLSAVLVESELLGGECSYWACMPSKTLLRDQEVLAEARRVPGAAAAVTGTLDVARVLARRDEFVHHFDDASQREWAAGAGIDVARGTGRVTGARTVAVAGADGGERELAARHAVVVATGTSATVPPVAGLREASPWTSREGTAASEVPARLAVLGGGPVGCELATAWSALGSRVTLVDRNERLLHTLEPFAGEQVGEALRGRGVDVRLGTALAKAARVDGGGTTLTLDDGDGFDVDTVLVAMGRTPRTRGIGLEELGLEPGAPVDVDETCRATGVPGGWLYAVGDANGRQLLTHMGKYQARACGDAIVARARGQAVDGSDWSPYVATADRLAPTSVVFSDPLVGAVGLTAAAAAAEGVDVRVVDCDIAAVAGAAIHSDGYVGRARLVVDEGRGVLAGATFTGPQAGELLHSATVAVVGGVPLARLWHAVPAYPTVSEVWLRLLEAYGL